MITARYIEWEGSFGCEYLFAHAGEALPTHSHDGDNRDLRHATRVIRGSARLEMGESQITYLSGGEIVFDSEKPHRIVALQDATILFHRLIERPADWHELLISPPQVTHGL